MLRRSDAFSLLESLCMIVTLFVFGWLCVGVVRYEVKNANVDRHAGVMFTTSDKAPEADKKAESKPDKAATPAEKDSKPAGSEAAPTAKPQ